METQTSSTSSFDRKGLSVAGAFAALLLLLLIGLGFFGRYLEGDAYVGARADALARAENVDVVVSGASVARHVELSAMCLDGVNLWQQSQDLFEGEALARHIKDKGQLPAVWILGVVPGFTTIDKGAEGASGAEKRILAYRILQASGTYRLIGGDWEGASRSIATPVLGYTEWRPRVAAALAGDEFEPVNPASDIAVTPQESERQSRDRVMRGDAERKRVRYHDDGIPERAQNALLALNDLMIASGGRLVVVEMPATPELQALSYGQEAADLDRETRFLELLERKGASVLRPADYRPQPRERFRDFLHLTNKGGFAFSRELGEVLASRGLIETPACAGAQTGEGLPLAAGADG